MNRLVREANHRAEGYWLSSRAGLILVTVQGGLMIGTPIYTFEHWRRLVGYLLLVGFGWIMERRHRARAAWMQDTEQWWEKLDDAPSILPFPRLNAAMYRGIDRVNDSRLGRLATRRRERPQD